MRQLGHRGFRALVYLATVPTKMVLSLVDTLTFANPEALILNEKWRTMLQTPVYQKKLFGIVADKAHVITKW